MWARRQHRSPLRRDGRLEAIQIVAAEPLTQPLSKRSMQQLVDSLAAHPECDADIAIRQADIGEHASRCPKALCRFGVRVS